jgi:hypothetical protein
LENEREEEGKERGVERGQESTYGRGEVFTRWVRSDSKGSRPFEKRLITEEERGARSDHE